MCAPLLRVQPPPCSWPGKALGAPGSHTVPRQPIRLSGWGGAHAGPAPLTRCGCPAPCLAALPGSDPQHQLGDLLLQARVRKFGPKLLRLLAEWTETFPRDFQEEVAIGLLKDVVGRLTRCDEVGEPEPFPACTFTRPEPAPTCSLSPRASAPLWELAENPGLHPVPLLPCSHHCHPQVRGHPPPCGCWSGRWSGSGGPAWQGPLGLGPQASPSCPGATPGLVGSQPPRPGPARQARESALQDKLTAMGGNSHGCCYPGAPASGVIVGPAGRAGGEEAPVAPTRPQSLGRPCTPGSWEAASVLGLRCLCHCARPSAPSWVTLGKTFKVSKPHFSMVTGGQKSPRIMDTKRGGGGEWGVLQAPSEGAGLAAPLAALWPTLACLTWKKRTLGLVHIRCPRRRLTMASW